MSPYLYGASLLLVKKDGGIRPIAAGSVFRRLVAKIAYRAIRENVSGYLSINLLLIIHATQTFVMSSVREGSNLLKLTQRVQYFREECLVVEG